MATRALKITYVVHIHGLQIFLLNSAALENFFFLLGHRPQFNYNYAIRKAPLPDKKAQPTIVFKESNSYKEQTMLETINKTKKQEINIQ